MRIGDLARRSGMNASAIRYYESVGLLKPAERVAGQRHYSPEAVDRVLLIPFASDMGFTLSEIKLFLDGLRGDTPVGPRWKKLAQRKIQEVKESIHRSQQLKLLLNHLLRCQCASLKVCVRRLSLSPDPRRVGPQNRTRNRMASRLVNR